LVNSLGERSTFNRFNSWGFSLWAFASHKLSPTSLPSRWEAPAPSAPSAPSAPEWAPEWLDVWGRSSCRRERTPSSRKPQPEEVDQVQKKLIKLNGRYQKQKPKWVDLIQCSLMPVNVHPFSSISQFWSCGLSSFSPQVLRIAHEISAALRCCWSHLCIFDHVCQTFVLFC
jgi:hypothetical protein